VLITDETLSTEEQQRVKVAFAEGYLAGSGQRAPGRAMKLLKIIQQLLTIVIFLAIFISFMGKALQWRHTRNRNSITTQNHQTTNLLHFSFSLLSAEVGTTSPTSSGRSVSIVPSWTKATEFSFSL
jgi:hypothetical protein